MRILPPLLLSAGLVACGGDGPAKGADSATATLDAAPSPALPTPRLRRLTAPQYENTVADLFGSDIVLPTALEPDLRDAGLQSVGASSTSLSPRGVEQYEDAAFLIAEQVADHPDKLAAWLDCTPSGTDDADCAASFVEALGRRAWRRPLTADESSTLSELLTTVGTDAGDFEIGAMYAIAAILQSPAFVYRVELGAEGPDGERLLTDLELASRLSYLLWNTTPDEALLAAAEAGELSTVDGLRAQAERMLADPRGRTGVETFFTEVLELDLLADATKDPTLFVQASPEVAPAAEAETLATIDHLVFDVEGDYRTLFTTRTTFIGPRLAAIYGVPSPSLDGVAQTELPEDGGRRGLLGQASFLMLNAHTSSSSATLRGKFVRERLLCQTMPAPPANVDTSIPEADATSPTLRERIATHLEVEECAGCHRLMDPIGLGFENFDAIGRWRDTEAGATIDASGDLDGDAFGDAWALGGAVAEHAALGPCFTQNLYKYALGQDLSDGEEAYVAWLGDAFEYDEFRVQAAMLRIIEGPAFRRVGEIDG
jgi:hypothetical protein